jgi:hypothetical protein
MLSRVGELTGGEILTRVDDSGQPLMLGQVRLATEIDVIEVGGVRLKKSRCEEQLSGALRPGVNACVYVFRHFWRTPLILGVKYTDTGEKYLASASWIRNSLLQFVVIWPIFSAIGCAVGGGIVFSVIGLTEFGVVLGILGGIGLAWFNAYRLWADYAEAKGD